MEQLIDKYEARKERYMKEGVPFMSYLHCSGWMFLRLDEIKFVCEGSGDPRNLMYRSKHGRIKIGPRGKRDFDRVVADLRKKGSLIDVTYYTPEVVSTSAV